MFKGVNIYTRLLPATLLGIPVCSSSVRQLCGSSTMYKTMQIQMKRFKSFSSLNISVRGKWISGTFRKMSPDLQLPSFSWQTETEPNVIFCSWSPSASGFHMWCILRCFPAHRGCRECWFKVLSYQLEQISPCIAATWLADWMHNKVAVSMYINSFLFLLLWVSF